MQFIIMRDSKAMGQAIADLAKTCEYEIAKADRPTDAFPLKAIVPLFVVKTEHLEKWKDRVAPELWASLSFLTDRCFICPADEAGLQSQYYALDHKDLAAFQQGLPVLKIVSGIKHQILNGRTKHIIEIKIREALEFEVFLRDIEIGELLSAKSRLLKNSPVIRTRGSGLEFLCK